jgi:glycosyltransferase involved in cell wall biosynthesis
MTPLLSIITPNYNCEAFIEETLKSVISQKSEKIQYIVVDGSSTDRSMEIIDKYSKSIDIIISEPDEGQADAINKGMRLATGKFVAYLNSDDYYMPGALQKIINLIDNNPDMKAVYGDNLNWFPDGSLVARPKVSWDFGIALNYMLLIPQPACFWSRELMNKVNGFDSTMNDTFDYDFFLRAFKSLIHPEILHIRDLIVVFRHHEYSKTTNNQKNIKLENKRSRMKHTEFVSNKFLRFFIKRYYQSKLALKFLSERGILIVRPFR